MSVLNPGKVAKPSDPILEAGSLGERFILSEDEFKRGIALERKRTERSREPFLLMLLEVGHRPGANGGPAR